MGIRLQAKMVKVKVGIIGGSGFYKLEALKNPVEKFVKTPFGDPSDSLFIGQISDVDCVVLARHGRNHGIMPTNINNRANIWALKQEGCTHLLVSTACGSLKEEIAPGNLVLLEHFMMVPVICFLAFVIYQLLNLSVS